MAARLAPVRASAIGAENGAFDFPGYPTAAPTHDAMQLLLERSPPLRPRGSPLAGPFNNGKSMIPEYFAADQQRAGVIQKKEVAGLEFVFEASKLHREHIPRR
ncbi:MAG: hypothetical protein HLUCCA05_14895 [Roseibaca calidilacus]|uniref:Uncharacterized protein n=1 Tax=Roseibaca calidilacus TaxID=1666912 RepID=A0A0P7X2W9_9RHOB|nr:TniB family NTP-binding protein [Roseibaca calidilacus]KPP94923.1 MAG: hypothetical protein HLUCCA05_14895 [Roseibaca calidilacus]CUX81292.1 hypothetical protein Ga0058931_1673 [Roseibaca calidilacus]